jgi:cytochrome b pre-mRNA-processing protein 3
MEGQGSAMKAFLARFLGTAPAALPADGLYAAVVAEGRQPHWYAQGGVADSVTGRFNMIATVLSFVLLRLERESAAMQLGVQLTERFIDDMEGQLRQDGVGDTGVAAKMGKLVSLLGGRLGAFRDSFGTTEFEGALVRNLYGGAHPARPALAHSVAKLEALATRLAAAPLEAIEAGRW